MNNQNCPAGLDLGPLFRWYRSTLKGEADRWDEVESRLHKYSYHASKLDAYRRGLATMDWQLPYETMRTLFELFPHAAMERISYLLRSVSSRPSLWLKQASSQQHSFTGEEVLALTRTAIVPSYTTYHYSPDNILRKCDIVLCEIPYSHTKNGVFDEDTRYLMSRRTVEISTDEAQLVLAQGFVRELANVLITDAWMRADGRQALLEIGRTIEVTGCGPMSHRSAYYWPDEHQLLWDPKNSAEVDLVESQVPLRKEVAETITALLLGFAFCESFEWQGVEYQGRDCGLDPLGDRPAVQDAIEQFLGLHRYK